MEPSEHRRLVFIYMETNALIFCLLANSLIACTVDFGAHSEWQRCLVGGACPSMNLSKHELRVYGHVATPRGTIMAPRWVRLRGEDSRECPDI
ncbi:MAG: hypothetical protein ACI9W2_001922 [Gammaproteobacteria bacterium]